MRRLILFTVLLSSTMSLRSQDTLDIVPNWLNEIHFCGPGIITPVPFFPVIQDPDVSWTDIAADCEVNWYRLDSYTTTADFLSFLACFGSADSLCIDAHDLTGDEQINTEDVLEMLASFGPQYTHIQTGEELNLYHPLGDPEGYLLPCFGTQVLRVDITHQGCTFSRHLSCNWVNECSFDDVIGSVPSCTGYDQDAFLLVDYQIFGPWNQYQFLINCD